MNELEEAGFISLYEHDEKVFGLYGLWSLANRSEVVEVGFTNLKPNGQTMQRILEINTIKYISIENNKRQKKSSSLIEFKDIPRQQQDNLRNTQDINEEELDSTPNGTIFKTIPKAYKTAEIEPFFDSKHKIGHRLEKKGQQLYICYADIEVEYKPEESQGESPTKEV